MRLSGAHVVCVLGGGGRRRTIRATQRVRDHIRPRTCCPASERQCLSGAPCAHAQDPRKTPITGLVDPQRHSKSRARMLEREATHHPGHAACAWSHMRQGSTHEAQQQGLARPKDGAGGRDHGWAWAEQERCREQGAGNREQGAGTGGWCVCVRVRVRVRACVCACVCVWM